MYTTHNVLLTCKCGTLPLEKAQHRDAQSAWTAASIHVALNPALHMPENFGQPTMTRVEVPLALSK